MSLQLYMYNNNYVLSSVCYNQTKVLHLLMIFKSKIDKQYCAACNHEQIFVQATCLSDVIDETMSELIKCLHNVNFKRCLEHIV